METNRKLFFLSASFFSMLGDSLLVFAVPSGLGLETNDIRPAVLMWLVPAIAIFLSTYFSKRIAHRRHEARVDYARLLLGLGCLELLIALLSLGLRSKLETLILICIFVFIYALAKEGIPRLLYTVSVYRYFVSDKEYTELAGTSAALGVMAGIFGALLAAVLISADLWKLGLVIDAATFIAFGFVILKFGKDTKSNSEPGDAKIESPVFLSRGHHIVLFSAPLLFGLNALVWNYLPLITKSMGAAAPTTSLLLIAFLRVPGILSGFRISQLSQYLSLETLVLALPITTLAATVLFIAFPSIVSVCILILIQGLVAGLYWPADYSLRSSLPHRELVVFNTRVVRRFSLIQLIACILALFIYEDSKPSATLVYLGVAIITLASLWKANQPFKKTP